MMRKATTPSGCTLMNCHSALGRLGSASTGMEGVPATVAMGWPSAQADAGIEQAVEQVHGEVHEHEDGGNEQHETLDQIEVAARGGVDEQLADAVDVEYLLGDDEPADQERELEAHHRHHGQHGVAQRVPAHDETG